MTTQRGDRLLRWTTRALAPVAALCPTLAAGPAAAAPADGIQAGAGSDVVVTGAASATLLLLLAGAVLIGARGFFRQRRSRSVGSTRG
ncbi:hypothetical protein AB0M46_09535 [Dactylosporangium sp. NPDC051485]|uniref:hypothetical protein n=1 Tax=Dactylosporangium sp. NPDC051485 TaxID=3154846 RepID=UPI00341A4B5A